MSRNYVYLLLKLCCYGNIFPYISPLIFGLLYIFYINIDADLIILYHTLITIYKMTKSFFFRSNKRRMPQNLAKLLHDSFHGNLVNLRDLFQVAPNRKLIYITKSIFLPNFIAVSQIVQFFC